tara:strand:+ start:720 stop:1622 length:903 start_codon:yes stop_codon:yes gene_type:complete
MGPTASGKTDLAISLFKDFDIEIVSVDSVMLYNEFNIGSAKPDNKVLKIYPHRMINILEPWEKYSVAKFYEELILNIKDIHKRKKTPLLVGGTIMYFKTFLSGGLSDMNEVSNEIKNKIQKMLHENDLSYLYGFLKKVDKASAEKVHFNDKYRILRLLEIYFSNDLQKPSTIMKQCAENVQYSKNLNISILPNDRSILHSRIEERFKDMMKKGLLDEISQIKDRHLGIDLPAMKTIGYRQGSDYLDGKIDIDSMKLRTLAATRQLAKRQITWLRHLDASTVYTSLDYGNIHRRIANFLAE